MVLAVAIVLAILMISEWGWRQGWLRGEAGRKFVHITVGSFVAFWPFFLTWTDIRILSIAFLAVVLISQYFRVFHAIHSVQRPTYGEVWFALIVGFLTVITHDKGIYAAAILQMSLADGFAAVVGTHYGRENKYHLLGHAKSVVGTATFFVISLGILVGYSWWSTAGLAWPMIFLDAVVATAIENFTALGFDNLLVPLVVGLLLTWQ